VCVRAHFHLALDEALDTSVNISPGFFEVNETSDAVVFGRRVWISLFGATSDGCQLDPFDARREVYFVGYF
jgi:hypothetical protein